MGALLSRAYRDCDDDDEVRAIVVTGAGSAFCAGADFSSDTSPFDAPGADDSLHGVADRPRRVRACGPR